MLKLTDWIVSKLSLLSIDYLSTIVKSKLIYVSAVSISSFEVFLSFTIWHLFTLVSCQMYSCPGGISELKSFADNWIHKSCVCHVRLHGSKMKFSLFSNFAGIWQWFQTAAWRPQKKTPRFLSNVMNYFLFFNEWVLFMISFTLTREKFIVDFIWNSKWLIRGKTKERTA